LLHVYCHGSTLGKLGEDIVNCFRQKRLWPLVRTSLFLGLSYTPRGPW
jgi:hypothetical protein